MSGMTDAEALSVMNQMIANLRGCLMQQPHDAFAHFAALIAERDALLAKQAALLTLTEVLYAQGNAAVASMILVAINRAQEGKA